MNTHSLPLVDISERYFIPGRGRLEGIEHKHVVVDTHGKQWLLKSQAGHAEYVAQLFVAAAGLRSIEVVAYDGPFTCNVCHEHRVLIEWVDSVSGKHIERERQNSEHLFIMSVLDYIINNTDRHAGNYLVDDDGSIIPIDHSFSLQDDGIDVYIKYTDGVPLLRAFRIARRVRDAIFEALNHPDIPSDVVEYVSLRATHLFAQLKYDYMENMRGKEHEARLRAEAEARQAFA